MADMRAISEALQRGQADKVKELVSQAIKEGAAVKKILDDGLIAGMTVVGAKFKRNEFYVPEVLIAARAMNQGMTLLEPLLMKEGVKPKGTVLIGTVKGDLHDIGKNLVAMMLSGAGIELVDLGIDVPPETFAKAIEEHHPQIVGISALLTTTMREMERTIQFLEEAGLRDSVRIMVGGAPVTEDFAQRIGADGYGRDAVAAVNLAREWLDEG